MLCPVAVKTLTLASGLLADIPLVPSIAVLLCVANASIGHLVSPQNPVVHRHNQTIFCCERILKLCKIFGMVTTKTSSSEPKGNGVVERQNRVIADMVLRSFAENPNN